MLSRTAENLFWMARDMERAENTARMLDVSFRMALFPSTLDKQELHFEPPLRPATAASASSMTSSRTRPSSAMWRLIPPIPPRSGR
jgi:uncharacterized alpha-E superfamily protein